MINRILIVAFTGSMLLNSCGNDTKKVTDEPEIVSVDTSKEKGYTAAPTEVKFKDPKVAAVYQQYIDLKTALVNSDAITTAAEAVELKSAFSDAIASEDALLAVQTVAESKDVEAQRTAFVTITETVEKMLDGAIESGVIYKQFCPMAFDFKGGFWLSNSKEIYNPYFGDQMLHCGKVDSKIE